MALESIQQKYIPQDNAFYREHYHHLLLGLMGLVGFFIIMVLVVLYEVIYAPLPEFTAVQSGGKQMVLKAYDEPNLQSTTILKWASKAAVDAYSFNFVNYNQQLATVRPYFTEDGYRDYLNSASALLTSVVKNQLFVTGVVSGPPVISNEGPLPGQDYVWRIQIPFLVTYQSSNSQSKRNLFVIMTVVRVPTDINPQGIGIDQFVME